MNIFILDLDVGKCARYHCDKHVVKMILESAQILCTAANLSGMCTPYRSTHTKHPCVKWATKSIQNWRWLRKLAAALNQEFKYRFDRRHDHASFKIIKKLKEPLLPDIGLTTFAQAMPDIYKVKNDAVQAYRNYYVGMKQPIATWKRRRVPKWFREMTGEKNV